MTISNGSVDLTNGPLVGTVKWFSRTRGFGFVTVPSENHDYHIHYTTLQAAGRRDVAEGATIRFSATEAESGFRVQEVLGITAAESDANSKFDSLPDRIWLQPSTCSGQVVRSQKGFWVCERIWQV